MVSSQSNSSAFPDIRKRTRMVGSGQTLSIIDKIVSSLTGKIKAKVLFVIQRILIRFISLTLTLK